MKKKLIVTLCVVSMLSMTACGANQTAVEPTETIEPTEIVAEVVAETETATEEVIETEEVIQTEEVEVTETTEEAEYTVTAMEKVMYATQSVKMRQGPSTDYEVVTTLKSNDEVKVTGQADTGWYEIDINGTKGFVSDSFLSDEKKEVVASETTQTATDTTQTASSSTSSSNGKRYYGSSQQYEIYQTGLGDSITCGNGVMYAVKELTGETCPYTLYVNTYRGSDYGYYYSTSNTAYDWDLLASLAAEGREKGFSSSMTDNIGEVYADTGMIAFARFY